MSTSDKTGYVSFLELLALLFIGLKLCGVVAWSWWHVTCPLWIPVAASLLTPIFAGAIVGFCILFGITKGGKK